MTAKEIRSAYKEFTTEFGTLILDNMEQADQFISYLKKVGYVPVRLSVKKQADGSVWIIEKGRM